MTIVRGIERNSHIQYVVGPTANLVHLEEAWVRMASIYIVATASKCLRGRSGEVLVAHPDRRALGVKLVEAYYEIDIVVAGHAYDCAHAELFRAGTLEG